jgi:hypothetical protein
MGSFSTIITAEFQVTGIDVGPLSLSAPGVPSQLRTGVRYELVGSAKDFYREQRVGQWELEWEVGIVSGKGISPAQVAAAAREPEPLHRSCLC